MHIQLTAFINAHKIRKKIPKSIPNANPSNLVDSQSHRETTFARAVAGLAFWATVEDRIAVPEVIVPCHVSSSSRRIKQAHYRAVPRVPHRLI